MPNLGCLNSHENTGVRQSWILKFENGIYMNIGIWYFNWLIRVLIYENLIYENWIELGCMKQPYAAEPRLWSSLVRQLVCAEKMGHPLEENNASGPAFSGTLMYWNHEKSCIILNLNWMNYVLSSREDSNLYIMYINSKQCCFVSPCLRRLCKHTIPSH